MWSAEEGSWLGVMSKEGVQGSSLGSINHPTTPPHDLARWPGEHWMIFDEPGAPYDYVSSGFLQNKEVDGFCVEQTNL